MPLEKSITTRVQRILQTQSLQLIIYETSILSEENVVILSDMNCKFFYLFLSDLRDFFIENGNRGKNRQDAEIGEY